MTSDLDKYGLVALTIIVVLILFIAVSDLNDEAAPPDEPIPGIRLDDILPEEEIEETEVDVVVLFESDGNRGETDGFDFMEDPVTYPGGPSSAPGDTTRPGGGESGDTSSSTPGRRIHRVGRGETLSLISTKYLGSSRRWRMLLDANPGVNPKSLKVGQKLVIPSLSSATPAKKSSRTGVTPAPSTQERVRYHTVKKGDTLGRIARTYYGSSGRWRRIHDANRAAIPDHRKLKIGAKLVIPY